MAIDMFGDCYRRLDIERDRESLVDRINKAQADLKALEAERVEVDARIARRIRESGDADCSVPVEIGYQQYTINLGPKGEVQVRNARSWTWAKFAERSEEAEAAPVEEADAAPVEESSPSSRPLPSDDLPIDDDPAIAERRARVGHPAELVAMGRD